MKTRGRPKEGTKITHYAFSGIYKLIYKRNDKNILVWFLLSHKRGKQVFTYKNVQYKSWYLFIRDNDE